MPDQLLVELIISDDKATAVIGKNRRALESFASDTERLKPKFGKNFESEFDAVERRANSFRDKLTNSFRTIGAAVSFAAVFKFLDGAKDKAFEAEKANFRLASAATEAGLAYGVLGQKSRQFANDAGLAETAAASVEARIAQLATFSGKPENIDKLNTAFLDLSAAKGISSNELDNLIGTILSGQDEGLNRLGIGDPSTLYAKYKVEIGAVSRELTQMEKVQAAVNAVLEKSATFAGANADKMNSHRLNWIIFTRISAKVWQIL